MSDGRTGDGPRMKRAIKRVMTDLLIRHGYRGASIRLVAEALGITTTNIFYHFGSKEALCDLVIEDYVEEALTGHGAIWRDPKVSLRDKLDRFLEFNRKRYRRYNGRLDRGRAWSLIGRMRLESDILSRRAQAELSHFREGMHDHITCAVELARHRGELAPDAPVEEITILIVNLANSSSVFTQDAGSFERLEKLVRAIGGLVETAYGRADWRHQPVSLRPAAGQS